MNTLQRLGMYLLCGLGTQLLFVGVTQAAEPGSGYSAMSAASTNMVQVPIYKSRTISARTPVRKISVGNPDIADILITSPTQLYLLGRSLGTTNVLLWDSNNRLIETMDVEVVHDLTGLKTKLHQLLPEENIEVFSAQGALVLRGQVRSAAAMDTAMKVAKTYAAQTSSVVQGKGEAAEAAPAQSLEVINLLSVGGSQQVMLEVKVAEMQRSLIKNLNVRFNALGSSGNWSGGGFNNGQGLGLTPGGGSILSPGSLIGGGKGLFAQFLSDDFLFNVVLEASKDNGSAKVLAEPTLTTLTGQQAEFISGGEFPIPITEDDGITIEYKEFGGREVPAGGARLRSYQPQPECLGERAFQRQLAGTRHWPEQYSGRWCYPGHSVADQAQRRVHGRTWQWPDHRHCRSYQRKHPRFRQPFPWAGGPADTRAPVPQPVVHQR